MQRYFCDKKENNKFILNDSDIHHIKNVMRMQEKDLIEIVFNECLYICNSDGTIISKKDVNRKTKKVILIVPILKEQKMDYILQKSTELGVSEIIPVRMNRCNINYGSKEDAKVIRWNKICKEASQQCKRLNTPIVRKIIDFKSLKLDDGLKILCSTKEKSKSIKNVLKTSSICDKLYIVVGPEGGLTDNEEEYLKQKKFISVTLGDNILRSETVPLFVLSVINYESME